MPAAPVNLIRTDRPFGGIPLARWGRHEPEQDAQTSGCGRPSPVLVTWFAAYARRYVRRHMHTVRVSRSGPPPPVPGRPLVVYLNHAAWWDPLICLLLARACFPGRVAFAPMDAGALRRYGFFRRLGFFGVEPGTRRGALEFLRRSAAVLAQPTQMLWLTPQGRFSDVRERPLRFHAGLGHLAATVEEAVFLPLALEYVHWEERCPEVLARFGEPVSVRRGAGPPREALDWTARFERELERTLDALAVESRRRDPEDFQVLLRGRTGVGGSYDWWRRTRAWFRGETFQPAHGSR